MSYRSYYESNGALDLIELLRAEGVNDVTARELLRSYGETDHDINEAFAHLDEEVEA